MAVGLDVDRRARRRADGAGAKKTSFRPDIQGLRAFAVIVVVLDHLFGWPAGGFIGVDVFFVVSGFLITGLLLREYERTGHISFVDFYRRRVKRILPAAWVVLAFTVVSAYFLFGQARFLSTVVDAIWSLLFAANWRFASAGSDYFQASGPVSPLQHYWSLGVEEQFYFVWPWLMLLVFVLFLRGRRAGSGSAARIAAGTAIGIISLASFGWAMWETATSPTVAYYSTLARGWELGLGAALAVVAPALTRVPAALRPVLAWIGLLGMTASLFLIDGTTPFPGPGAVLPVLATGLVIAAGTGAARHRGMWVLTNPVSRYVGDISYSMYLWHWPIIVFGGVLLTEPGPLRDAVFIGAIIIASVYSYHLVEDPIRRSKWLDGASRRAAAQGGQGGQGGQPPASADLRRPRPERSRRGSRIWAWSSFVLVVVIAVTAFQLTARTTPGAAHAGATSPPVDTPTSIVPPPAEEVGPETVELRDQIVEALAATEWPELDPTIDEAIATGDTAEDILPCGLIVPYDEERCTFGDSEAEHTVVLVGDSTSMTYVQAFHEALGNDQGWQVKSYGTFGCSFMEPLIDNSDPNVVANCTARKDAAVDAINELKPDLVFITNTYDPRIRVDNGAVLGPEEWKQAMRDIVARFQGSVGQLVFLAPPPNDLNIAACYSQVSVPADCVSHVTEQWATFAEADAEVASELGARFVTSEPWFCVDGSCPAFVGGVPTKSDHVHMLPAYASKIAPAILEELHRQDIL